MVKSVDGEFVSVRHYPEDPSDDTATETISRVFLLLPILRTQGRYGTTSSIDASQQQAQPSRGAASAPSPLPSNAKLKKKQIPINQGK